MQWLRPKSLERPDAFRARASRPAAPGRHHHGGPADPHARDAPARGSSSRASRPRAPASSSSARSPRSSAPRVSTMCSMTPSCWSHTSRRTRRSPRRARSSSSDATDATRQTLDAAGAGAAGHPNRRADHPGQYRGCRYRRTRRAVLQAERARRRGRPSRATSRSMPKWRRCSDQTDHARARLFWEAAGLLPVTLIEIIMLTLIVGRPLRQIDRAIGEIGHGSISHPIAVKGPHDLERLGAAARMAAPAAARGRAGAQPLPAPHVARAEDAARQHPRGHRASHGRSGRRARPGAARGHRHPARQRHQAAADDREPALLQRLADLEHRHRDRASSGCARWSSRCWRISSSPSSRSACASTCRSRMSRCSRRPRQDPPHTGEPGVECRQILPEGRHHPHQSRRGRRASSSSMSPTTVPASRRRTAITCSRPSTPAAPPAAPPSRAPGIGLSVVLEFVAAHGGTVQIVDGEYPGAHFRIRMPMGTAREPLAGDSAPAAGPGPMPREGRACGPGGRRRSWRRSCSLGGCATELLRARRPRRRPSPSSTTRPPPPRHWRMTCRCSASLLAAPPQQQMQIVGTAEQDFQHTPTPSTQAAPRPDPRRARPGRLATCRAAQQMLQELASDPQSSLMAGERALVALEAAANWRLFDVGSGKTAPSRLTPPVRSSSRASSAASMAPRRRTRS